MKLLTILVVILSTNLVHASETLDLTFSPTYLPYIDTPFITDTDVKQIHMRADQQSWSACPRMLLMYKANLISENAPKFHTWSDGNVHQYSKWERWFLSHCMVSVSSQIKEYYGAR